MVRFGVAAGVQPHSTREHACAPMTIRKKLRLPFPLTKTFPLHWGNHHHLSATRFSDYAQKSCDNKGVTMASGDLVRYVITVMLHEDT